MADLITAARLIEITGRVERAIALTGRERSPFDGAWHEHYADDVGLLLKLADDLRAEDKVLR